MLVHCRHYDPTTPLPLGVGLYQSRQRVFPGFGGYRASVRRKEDDMTHMAAQGLVTRTVRGLGFFLKPLLWLQL
jgi:hypothetical protein